MKKLFLLSIFLILLTSLAYGRPVVVLMTDFGLNNEAVGLCHGAILAINSEIEVVDLCHNVKAFDIEQAGLFLKGTECFPEGTVFVNVIDPGVGTDRNSIAIKTKKELYYIAPNNGLLTYVIKDQGIEEAYELDKKKINPKWEKGTFDGRDLFSPAGAILATSNGNLDSIGRPIKTEDVVLFEIKVATVYEEEGKIIGIYNKTDEPYGNVWTNITSEDLLKISVKTDDTIHITAENIDMEIPFVTAFGDVQKGEALAYINSEGTLAFAINQGNFEIGRASCRERVFGYV
mgnify:FL=1